MRLRPSIGVNRGSISPTADAVLTRLVNGTFEVNLERLADAILDKLQEDADDVASDERVKRMSMAGSMSSVR